MIYVIYIFVHQLKITIIIIMKKLIDIPEKNKVLERLQIKAVKAKTNLKNYIEDLLVKHANEKS